MSPRPVPFTQAIILALLLIVLVPLVGCQEATVPGEDIPTNPLNGPEVTVRDPAQIQEANSDVELALELSAGVAHPGEAVAFEATARNLLSEPLEYYGLVCWPDSPAFFLVDGAGTAYRVEWQPTPPCPAGIKHLPVGETATSRDWFSGWALLNGEAVELPFGDYIARAVYTYRPFSAPGDASSEFSVEAPFRWEATPE